MKTVYDDKEYKTRVATVDDAELLRKLASDCSPLDVHTPYTYWVIAYMFGQQCRIIEHNNQPIGFITALFNKDYAFIWQMGILQEYRGNHLSKKLYDEVFSEIVKRKFTRVRASIAEANTASKAALDRYCSAKGYEMNRIDSLELKDIMNPNFYESEVVYEIKI
jgi:diaminobutyrate acetyltransferase